MKNLTRKLKIAGLELPKVARLTINQTLFKSIKTCKHKLETQKNQFKRKKNRNQHANTPHPL